MEATVKRCVKVKEWNGKPIYSVELSDGRKGESFAEIPVNTSATEIEITPSDKGFADRFKLKSKNGYSGGGGGKPRVGNESFALSYAKDVACAHITQGKSFAAKDIISVADEFYNWLESKKK